MAPVSSEQHGGTASFGWTGRWQRSNCLLVVDDFRDVSAAIARCRRVARSRCRSGGGGGGAELDDDLRSLIAKAPGQRIPRTVDEPELSLQVVLGQQVSIKAARNPDASPPLT
jgi:AraC family transcriptional regulator, regulatory protein of adaptative response / DNA-3-methyladenine glycosylase II